MVWGELPGGNPDLQPSGHLGATPLHPPWTRDPFSHWM